MSMHKFRLALLQLGVTRNPAENLEKARKLIKEAASAGAQLICLPECFKSPYYPKSFAECAETIPGESSEMMSHCAKKHEVYLIGGTMLESHNGKLYSTSLVYGPNGSLLAKHRKLHLYEFYVPGKVPFRESDLLTPGDKLTTFDTPFCKVGLGVCYDVAFPAVSQIYADLGCKLLVFPGAFGMVEGPLVWELLQRSRAFDNQVYVATAAAARFWWAPLVSWGHSMLVDPAGNVVRSAGADEEIVIAEVDLEYLEAERNKMPSYRQKRSDVYSVESRKVVESNVEVS